MIRLDLAVNPVPQGRPVVVRNGRRINTYTPEKTTAFYAEFRWALKAAGIRRPVQGPLRLGLQLWRRCRMRSQRGDLSNMVKAIEDAGNGHLWDDDEQILEIDARLADWGPKVPGRIVIEIVQLARVAG